MITQQSFAMSLYTLRPRNLLTQDLLKKTSLSAILNMNGFHCIVHTCDIGVLPRIMKTYRSDKFRIVKEHASLFSDKSFLCQCTYTFTLLIFIYVTLYNKGT